MHDIWKNIRAEVNNSSILDLFIFQLRFGFYYRTYFLMTDLTFDAIINRDQQIWHSYKYNTVTIIEQLAFCVVL